jgi:hypothetical protein
MEYKLMEKQRVERKRSPSAEKSRAIVERLKLQRF